MSAPVLVHVTTTDISLELLLGPQLRAFHDAGYRVVTVSAPGPYVERLTGDGIEHVPLRHATRSMAPHRDLLATRELWSAFRRLRPDIVHTHNPKPGVYGRLAARAARVPVVVNTVHGLYAQTTDSRARRAVVYTLERVAARASRAELVQNPEDLETLRGLGIPDDKLILLGNGIDLDRFGRHPDSEATRRAVRRQLGLGPDDVAVGAVGRLVVEKGYLELFEAWRTVAARHPSARLVIVGPHDPEKADAVDQASLDDLVARTGALVLGGRDDVDRIYHALDLYVLASHREGFPRSAMEAAASGLPIVATAIRGCRQVVDDGVTGLLVPVRDPAALAAAIGELVEDPPRRARMAEAAIGKAAVEFDQQRVIDITLATYERLLGR